MQNEARLIDANALKRQLNAVLQPGICPEVERNVFAVVENEIDRIPTVDAAPVVTAVWRHIGGDEWCCTACCNVISTEGSWEHPYQKYCDQCGAKITGVEMK